jgi:hypothetical protein
MSEAASFRGLRRDIAFALRDRKRTLYETSKAMGRRPGDIQRTLRQMVDEGLIHSGDPKPVRGTLFWFNNSHVEALEAEVASNHPPGQLLSGQRILAIEAPEHADPYLVLGRNDLNGIVAWVAEWGGDSELLVGLTPGTKKLAAEQLVHALRDAGISCLQRRIGEFEDGAELRRRSAALAEAKRPVREEISA